MDDENIKKIEVKEQTIMSHRKDYENYRDKKKEKFHNRIGTLYDFA